jgi:A/G-specific adenine glycosylase
MDSKQRTKLRRTVWTHYQKHGRHDLPWRKTTNPYRILVSEVMLQQTQVARVIPKYQTFLKTFPTVRSLAEAPLRDVLLLWQGLGYNRRAKALHDAAQLVVSEHKGRMPRTYEGLLALPGIGPYTAGAVCAFAYNIPVPLVETNVRTVLFHHVLGNRTNVPDSELTELSAKLMDVKRPREWYWALMDYGAHLKEQGVRTNEKSKHYTKQSKFKGSTRELRGALVRTLGKGPQTQQALANKVNAAPERIRTQLSKLHQEGLVKKSGKRWKLA